VQWLDGTLRYRNKLTELVQQGPSLLCSVFLVNVAASGLAQAATGLTALQFVCLDQV
jgi:hypothetical protein